MPIGINMFPNHPNMNNLGGLDVRLQNVSGKSYSQSLPQVPIQDVSSYDFPGNQLPWKGPVQGPYGQQLGGPGRGVGFPDVQLLQQQQSLQSQQQLHEMHGQLFEQQLRQQLEHSRQQQMQQESYLQFPETSYSALLHGPDTPPLQPEPVWDAPIAELENQSAAGGISWPMNGASCYQGFSNDFLMGKDQGSEMQMGFYVDPSLYAGGGGSALAFHPGTQHILLEQPSSSLGVPSKIYEGMPMPQTFTSENTQPKDQGYSNPFAGRKIQGSGEQSMDHNQVSNSLHQINAQHHSHGLGLSQQRSWVFFDQKQDAPNQSSRILEGMEASLQNIPISEQNSSQIQQHSTNINMGNEKAAFSHYQVGNIMPEEGSFKQQRDWAMPSSGVPTGHNLNDSEREQYISWNALQAHRMHPGFGNHLQLPADAKYNTWVTNNLQEGHHFMENTCGLADTSGSMQMGPRNLQSGWQTGPANMPDSAATMAGSNFQPYQEGFYSLATQRARRESGFGSTIESENALQSSFESYAQYQDSWKNNNSLNQFVAGVETIYPSFNGDGHSSNWNPEFQQGAIEVKAMNSMPRKPGLGSRHNTNSQQNHERLLSAGGQVLHQIQRKYVQGPFVSQHATNFVKALEEQAAKSASDVSADRETSSHEQDVELEGPRVKKQREFSESDVGVAHLRRSQPSSPLSPQNVKLRLGPPSNLSKNLQEGGTLSRRKSFQVQDLDSNFPSSVSVGKDHNVQPFSDGHGFETEMDQETGTSVETHSVLQRSGMPSNFPPLMTRDSTQSEVPSSLTSGQMVSGEGGGLVAPTHAMCLLENSAGLSQRESKLGVDFLSGAEQVQGNATSNGYSQGKFLTGFIAESSPLGNNPRQQIMQDQHSVVTKQLGNRAQVANFPGLLTASLSRQSMNSIGHEKIFPEGMSSFRSTSHGVQGDAMQVMLETQTNMRRPTSSGVVIGEGPSSVSGSSIRSQNFEADYNVQRKPPHEQSLSLEASKFATPSLQSKLQEQRTPSLFQLNGVRSSPLQARGDRQDQNQFANSKAVPPQTGAQLKGFSRSALEMFRTPLPVQSQSVQPQMEMGRIMNESSVGKTHSEAWTPRIFESAVVAGGKLNETVPKPFNNQSNPGIMGKGALHHLAANALVAPGQSGLLSESKAMQHQNASFSEVGGQSKQLAADPVLYTHGQSLDQVLPKDVVRGTNSMTMNVEAWQSVGSYSRVIDNEQLVTSQASAYHNPSARGRDFSLSQQLDQKQNQVVQYSGHHTLGVEYSTLRDREPIFSTRIAQEQLSQHQFSTSKPNFHAPITIHAKKRKKPVPLLIPWHIAATHPGGQLPSISKAELMWSNATNRLPEKDAGEIHNESTSRAETRLRLTTQLMQQLIPPLPSVLMHGNKPVDNECAIYNLAKIALGEACRMIAGTEREADPAQKGIDSKTMALHGTWGLAKDVVMTRLLERFMERVKHLDSELARLDCSTSALELKGKTHDLEKLSIVNRLAKHHGTGFSLDFSESIFVENIPDCGPGIRRPPPQKYVIAVPMPRTLPEGVRCLSL